MLKFAAKLAGTRTGRHHPGRSAAAAGIADQQARLIGALQYPMVTGDRATVARLLRCLAPMYAQLQASLPDG